MVCTVMPGSDRGAVGVGSERSRMGGRRRRPRPRSACRRRRRTGGGSVTGDERRGARVGPFAGPFQPSASQARLLSGRDQGRICPARQRTGWGPRLTAGAGGYPHSTVWKVLLGHGLSRRSGRPGDANRYEWPCPGDLRHMDAARYARFERPGHRVTGDRSQQQGRDATRPVSATTTPTRSSMTTRASAYVELHETRKPPPSPDSSPAPSRSSTPTASRPNG